MNLPHSRSEMLRVFRKCWIGLPLTLILQLLISGLVMGAEGDVSELQRLMQEQTAPEQNLESTVTSAGKHNQRLAETPAAIYVITAEDIRRSGVTNIPDALRMAPGLDVARIDSNKWAVTSRGFSGRFANKLLVLMDGREIYNPTFGGVYWEAQDTPINDIDRIEVIRGPNAAMWGANAVGGVINIITKSANDTIGGRLSAGVGTYERNFGSFRYGYRFDDNTAGRVWAKGFNRGSFDTVANTSSDDSWSQARTGFRIDHNDRDGYSSTVLGEAYSTSVHTVMELPSFTPPYTVTPHLRSAYSGFNLLGRWKKALSITSEVSLQAYYDHFHLQDSIPTIYQLLPYGEDRDTFDLDFQHRFQWQERHKIIWGLGYRLLIDHYRNAPTTRFANTQANKQLFNIFLQDEISVIENLLTLTLGTRLQHNDYTGLEAQPTGRLLWTPNEQNAVWAAISRAVRTPGRMEATGSMGFFTLPPGVTGNPAPLPVELRAQGNGDYLSEEVLAYELGYRFRPRKDLYADVAIFYNDYHRLRSFDWLHPSVSTQNGITAYLPFSNQIKAQAWGAELLVNWKPIDRWMLEAAYSYLYLRLDQPFGTVSAEMGNTPQQQVSLRSNLNLTDQVDFDLWLRYVDVLPLARDLHGPGDTLTPSIPRWETAIPAYVTLDARLAWRPLQNLELSLVGQNLLDSRHPEFQQEIVPPPRAQVPRSVYLKFDWQF